MRKVLVGVITVATLALFCSTTEAAKKKSKRGVSPAPSASPAAPPAAAPEGEWSLQEKQYWVKLQEEMDSYIKRANDRCGSKITGGFDKESFRGHLDEGGSYGLNSYARAHCAAGPSAIDDICGVVNGDEATAKMTRDTVIAKVSHIECRWGGKGKQAMSFANKKLVTTIDHDGDDNSSSLTTKVTTFMKQKL